MKKRYALIGITAALGLGLLGGFATSYAVVIPTVITKSVVAVTPPPMRIEVSPLVLVKAMEEEFKVTTFSMNLTVDEVKAGRCDGNFFQDLAYRDCLKMQVPGKVNAGFGRDILDPARITSTKDTVTINLGRPTIGDVVIDHVNVKVLNPDDDGGWLTDPNKNLQALGFVQAKERLRQAACAAGIHRSAALSAEKHYGELARHLLTLAGDVRTVKIVSNIPACKDVL